MIDRANNAIARTNKAKVSSELEKEQGGCCGMNKELNRRLGSNTSIVSLKCVSLLRSESLALTNKHTVLALGNPTVACLGPNGIVSKPFEYPATSRAFQ